MYISKKWARITISAALSASMLLPSASALFPAKVKADALYLRKSPGGEVIATLPQGVTVAVEDNSTSWFKVIVNGLEGYVSGAYLTGTPNEDFCLGQGRVVCETFLNVRAEPNTSAQVLTTIPNGTLISPIGMLDNWYKVVYNGQTGYVSPDYIKFNVVLTSNDDAETQLADAAITPSTYAELSPARQQILDYAAQFLGTPYVYGGSTPSGFDCSGFTSYVYANTYGSIPRVAQSQYDATPHLTMDELIPGDLVFFGSSPYSISHVGIYTGDGQFIHSPHTGDVVKYDSLDTMSSYSRRFQGGGRVIDD